MFLSLGWNFLEFGINPPPPETGLVWGWLICGVLFVAMGGIPLLFVLWFAKATLWGTDNGILRAKVAIRPQSATVAASRGPLVMRFNEPSVTTEPDPRPTEPDQDLVSDLEGLAALHRDGQLSDEEFDRSKAARLGEEGS